MNKQSSESREQRIVECRICGTMASHKSYTIREMMYGTMEPFEYLHCPTCHCLQIKDIPEYLARYYPPGYYSHRPRNEPDSSTGLKGALIKWFCRTAATKGPYSYSKPLRRLLPTPNDWTIFGSYLEQAELKSECEPVLDVGCGSSPYRLAAMKRCGFENVEGIDPFIDSDTVYFGVPVRKRTLDEVDGQYGLIMFHHSLEHVVDPTVDLIRAAKLLRPMGICLIRIPVMNTWFWREFGVHWVELDAPRHLHLMSVRSVELMASRAGFTIKKIVFDSEGWEIAASTLYQRGLTFHSGVPLSDYFTRTELDAFEEKACNLNRAYDAGRACFYLQRIN